MKNLILLVLIISFALPASAQLNLVYNSGFEQYTNCPSTYDDVKYAIYWNAIDTSWSPGMPYSLDPDCLPDYINGCSSNAVTGEPLNGDFYHYPHSGNGMMQVVMYDGDSLLSGNPANLRDYLQGRLRSTLIAGQSYCVTFYTVSESFSSYAINHIGAYLDDGSIDTTTTCNLPQTEYTPQILATGIINDTLNWTKIQGSFIANGTEKFITIGNFFDTANTAHIRLLTCSDCIQALYLIDDVSVIASNATAYAGPDVSIVIGSSTNIGVDSSGDGMPCYWYILGSTTPIDSGGQITVSPMDTTTYVVAMDLCGTITYDTVTVNVLPCPGTPVAAYTNTVTGATSNFTYTGTTISYDSVVWNYGDGNMDTGLNATHTYTASGTYTVCATVYTYCGNDMVCDTVGILPLGIAYGSTSLTMTNQQYTLSPDPNNGSMMLRQLVADANPVSAEVLNATGERVYAGVLHFTGGMTSFNMNDRIPGLYLLQLTDSKGRSFTLKFVIE